MTTSPSRARRDFLMAVGAGGAALMHAGPLSAMAPESNQPATPCAGIDAARSEYLLAPGLNYLNTASLGPASRAVLDRTLKAWLELESNPVWMTYGSGAVHVATDGVREQAARFIGCNTDELLIMRNTTDAMNSLAQSIRLDRGDRVLTTDQEHDGGSMCWRYRARRDGVIVDVVPIGLADHDDQAIVDRFAAAIKPGTRVISVSHVITSTGLRMPITSISALARQHGILCIVDGAQAVGSIGVDVKALGCHAYAASGHKWLLGPKGTGLLYVSSDAAKSIDPIQREDGIRFVSGSQGVGSLPLVVGLGAAIEAMQARGMRNVERYAVSLRNRAYVGLKQINRLRVVSPPPGPLATGIIAFELPADVDSRLMRDVLREKYGIIVKMNEKKWLNGIRLSPHIFNTESEIDAVLAALRNEFA